MALDMQAFFTAGADEVRAWGIRKGTKAPQAAGVIHTDFEKGFIMADTMAFQDLKDAGSEAAVKAAGKCGARARASDCAHATARREVVTDARTEQGQVQR